MTPGDPIIFSFTPTQSDYYQTMRLSVLQNKSFIRITVLIAVILPGIVFLLHRASYYPLLVIVFLAIFLIYAFFYAPASIAERYSKDERYSSEISWEVDIDKVYIHDKFMETRTDWGLYTDAFETGEYFLFLFSGNRSMFQFIPKRAFVTPEMLAGFHALLTQKFSRVRVIKTLRLPELSRKSVLFMSVGVLVILIVLEVALATLVEFILYLST